MGSTQKDRVLAALYSAGRNGIRSDYFLRDDVRIPRAAARVEELRKQGHNITSTREKQFTRYRLVGVGAGGSWRSPSADSSETLTGLSAEGGRPERGSVELTPVVGSRAESSEISELGAVSLPGSAEKGGAAAPGAEAVDGQETLLPPSPSAPTSSSNQMFDPWADAA